MMFPSNKSPLLSLATIQENGLMVKLIQQINKDFCLSGLNNQLEIHISPQSLMEQIANILLGLINFEFQKFLSLMYRIDVSESKITEIGEGNSKIIAQKITILLLKKEWQKISFKNKNQ